MPMFNPNKNPMTHKPLTSDYLFFITSLILCATLALLSIYLLPLYFIYLYAYATRRFNKKSD